jgi:hypothetical protein
VTVAKPAGVQIRRWFRLLVGILILVSVAALAGGMFLLRSARAVAEQARPLASVTAAMRHEVLSVQRDLFRYLSELESDTASAMAHLDALAQRVTEAKRLAASPEIESAVDEMETGVERYRKVLDLITPQTADGSRDWSRIQEYSEAAVAQGREVEEGAMRLAEIAQTELHRRDRESARIALAAVWASAGVLGFSLLVALSLRRWWKRFEDFILGL